MKMNTPQLLPIAALALACLVAGCATDGINARIQEKSTVFNELNDATQKNIREGTIEPGYTADMVYMALGKPSKVKVRDSSHGKLGFWIYDNSYPETAAAASSSGPLASNEPKDVSAHDAMMSRPGPSYTNTTRRDSKLFIANPSTFNKRDASMEPLDVPDMPSASLYVVFHEGRVVQMKLGQD